MTHLVGGPVELRAEFTLDDEPADPDSVTLTVRDPSGTPTTPTPDNDETGVWTHLLVPDSAGRWSWVFTGAGDAGQVVMGAVQVLDPFDNPQQVCTTAEVAEAMLPKTLTNAQEDQVGELIAELVDVLELRLNRLLYPRTVVETHVIPWTGDGRIHLNKGPVRSIATVTQDGVELSPTSQAVLDPASCPFPAGSTVVFEYEAGDDVRPATTGLVRNVIVRTLRAGTQAGSGVLKSYSVEGTSITYGDDVGGGGSGSSGRISLGDIRSLGRLRRPVIRW